MQERRTLRRENSSLRMQRAALVFVVCYLVAVGIGESVLDATGSTVLEHLKYIWESVLEVLGSQVREHWKYIWESALGQK